MPAYTNISNGLVAVGAKPFATTMQALRDNPLAIAEGDATAPRVLGKALGSTFLGGGVGNSGAAVTWLNLDAMETIQVVFSFPVTGNGIALQVDFSANNGSTWAGYQTLVAAHGHTAASGGSGNVNVNLRTGAISCAIAATLAATANYNSATLTPVSNCNAMRIRWATTGGHIAANAWCLGGLQG